MLFDEKKQMQEVANIVTTGETRQQNMKQIPAKQHKRVEL